MGQRVRVGAESDFAIGTATAVDAAGTSIVVAHADSGLCAVRNKCPHLGLSLTSGPGGTHFAGSVITCPWHNSRFQVDSGENLDWTPGVVGRKLPRWSAKVLAMGRKPAPLTTYPVVVEDGSVYVEI